MNHLKGTNNKNYSCQYWFGVSQKDISIYEMGDHERSKPIQQWFWPKLNQTEINGRKIMLKIIKNGSNNVKSDGDQQNTLRGTTLGKTAGQNSQQNTDAVEKVAGNDSILGKKLIETRTFYVQTPQYCQAVSIKNVRDCSQFFKNGLFFIDKSIR